MDQPKGESESGPHHTNEEKSLIFQLRNASILAETKMEIMQRAVAKCPKVCISAHWNSNSISIGFQQQGYTAPAVIF